MGVESGSSFLDPRVWFAGRTPSRRLRARDDILLGALYDLDQLVLLGCWNLVLVERRSEVGDHRLPLTLVDIQPCVRVLHRPACVLARATGHLAHQCGDVEFQAGFWHARPRLADRGPRCRQDDAGDDDACAVVEGVFVVTGGDAAPSLETVEGSLAHVARRNVFRVTRGSWSGRR